MDSRAGKKHGRFRMYIVFWSVPLCVLSILIFSPAPMGGDFGALWCFAIYLLWSLAYSFIEVANLPLLPLICGDGDRIRANTVKATACVMGAVASSFWTMKLVGIFGGESQQTGFFYMGLLFALVSFATIFTGGLGVRELFARERNDLPFGRSLKVLASDRRLGCFMMMYMFDQLAVGMKNQNSIYYLKYNIGREDLVPAFMFVGMLSSLAAQPLILYAARRMKRSVLMVAGYVSSAAAVCLLVSGGSVAVLFASNIIFGALTAIPANLVFVRLTEISEEIADSLNKDFSAIINSMLGIFSKIGNSLSGVVAMVVLSVTGYEPGLAQGSGALAGIKMCFAWLPGVTLLISAAFCAASYGRRTRPLALGMSGKLD